jgi:hypothetical protein
MFGTSDGRAIIMTAAGAMVTQVTLEDDQEIERMQWSCEKFVLEDWARDSDDASSDDGGDLGAAGEPSRECLHANVAFVFPRPTPEKSRVARIAGKWHLHDD